MPIFITQGRCSQSAITGMIAKPEDRAESMAKAMQQAGGKLLAYDVTLGEYDFMVISDMPSHKEISAVVLTSVAAGGATDLRTTLAMTSAEAKELFAATGKIGSAYRAPGSTG